MIEITEKNDKLLKIIAEYGGVYVEDIKDIYGGKKYWSNRLSKLLNENYIMRKNRILQLAYKGKYYLEEKGIEYRVLNSDISLRRRSAEIYKLSNKLKNFTFIPSTKVERITKNFAYKYYGQAISNTRNEYWIYRIGKVELKEFDVDKYKDLSEKQLEAVKKEIEEKNRRIKFGKKLDVSRIHTEIDQINKHSIEHNNTSIRVMVFVEDKTGMDIYKTIMREEYIDLAEHILIPYVDSGIDLANKYIGAGEGEDSKVLEQIKAKGIPAALKHKGWKHADFNINGAYGINLTTSNFNKETNLKDYLSITNDISNITLVCAHQQFQKYRNEFRGCSILVID